MSDKTKISWAESTWNVVTGCTKVSDGCLNCYIERTPPFRMAGRRFDLPVIGGTTGVQLHPDRLTIPLRWRKPRRIFVCSLADLFHDDVPDDFIARVFATAAACQQHTFQVLTKRPARMRSLLNSAAFREDVGSHWLNLLHTGPSTPRVAPQDCWPLPNIWVGVSVESQLWARIRIPTLLDTPAAVRWISAEPLLGPINLHPYWTLGGPAWGEAEPTGPAGIPMRPLEIKPRLDWVVTGGESGPGARPAHPDWFRLLRDQCAAAGIAYHHKQNGEYIGDARAGDPFGQGRDPWADREPDLYVHADGRTYDEDKAIAAGGTWHGVWRVGKKAAGRELDGQLHDAYPAVAHG